jgi:hypothetical protein
MSHDNNDDRAEGWRRLLPAAVLGMLLALALIALFFFGAWLTGWLK